MRTIGQFVDRAVKDLNAQKAIDFHRLKEAWLKAVGPILAGQAEPTKLRGGVLHVTVSSPAWSQEIQMQQRLILGRLKGSLLKAPSKIACWVGQPHAAGPAKSKDRSKPLSTDEQVAWAAVVIPANRQAVIEATLAALGEEPQREKIRPLMELAVRRELYFLERGQLPCPECGAMREVEKDSCDECLRERLAQAERRIMRLFARRPWLKIRDIHDLAPWAGRAQVIRLKKSLRTDLLQQAWQLAEGTEGDELISRITPAYRRLLLDITMLTCSLPAESLQPRHYTYALGKRLGQAYLATQPT